ACRLREGGSGLCRVRRNEGGVLIPMEYGRVAAVALDPVEKKPLRHFLPGSFTFSVGYHGCNLYCPYCQNASLSMADLSRNAKPDAARLASSRPMDPAAVVAAALRVGAPSISYTYNEPLVAYESVLDTAELARQAGLRNIVVTNGYLNEQPLRRLLPYIDAMNIDLKAFDDATYRTWCGGHLQPVLDTIALCRTACHVEITTLVVTGMNDSLAALEPAFAWLGSLDPRIPLHLSRYFPANRYAAPPTDTGLLSRLRDAALRHLERVYVGNI
ncbi:MAG TPA: AmmeMemoRadiSam system radical SAM enzyme, partial [Clostridia bacterium]